MPQQNNKLAPPKTIDEITNAACDLFHIDKGILRSKHGNREYADIRQIIFAIAYELGGLTYAAIGNYFGDRDHSCVIKGIARFNAVSTYDMRLKDNAISLLKKLELNAVSQHN